MFRTYQPVPTADRDSPSPGPLGSALEGAESAPPAESEPALTKKSSYHPRYAFLAFALILVAFVSFKAGQWSVHNFGPVRIGSEQQVVEASPQPSKTEVESGVNLSSPDHSSASASTAPTSASSNSPQASPTTMPSHGKYSVGYFVNWGIYGRKFPPSLIPVHDLTHVLYAFADVRADSGEVFLSDVWADKDIHYPGDSWDDAGNNLYGNFKQLYLLKKNNRHLKVLLSIGGWTYSPKFHPVVVSPSMRKRFVESSIKLLEDYGLDGLDVDYEYPSNDEQARGYVELLRGLREGLDRHAREKNAHCKFLLTIAAPCGPDNYKKLHVAEMDRYLDLWNMMAYDFSGSWDHIANHQANVYGGPISASQSIHWYISKGVSRSKIVMGIPLYGRSFMNTQGPGAPFSGIGPGSWEQGVYDYRALPLPGSHMFRDENVLASWSYDYVKKEMVSFDSEEVALWKGEWIKKEGLAGSMFWELSGDKGSSRDGMEAGPGKVPQPGRSLVKLVKEAMGGLRDEQNWLRYEHSQFENLKYGMN